MTEWRRSADRSVLGVQVVAPAAPTVLDRPNRVYPEPDLDDDRTGVSVRYTTEGYRWYLLYVNRKSGARIVQPGPGVYRSAREAEEAGRPVADEAAKYLHQRVYQTDGKP